MLKKYITVTILISWAFFTAVLVAGLVFYQNGKLSGNVNTNPGGSGRGATVPGATSVPALTLTVQEIAKHNSRSSCWLIINQQVYDVTTYLNQHPGNAGTILPYCGQEATAAFDDKWRPGGRPHSAFAVSLLQNYLLGPVGQTLSQPTISPSATSPQPSATIESISTVTQSVTSGPAVALTTQEIAKHNTSADCWLIINQQVYNVTTYLNQHPGNASTILPYCGQEATAAFNDKGRPGGSPHSSFAVSLLGAFLIGPVGQTVSQSNTVITATVPAGGGRRGDD